MPKLRKHFYWGDTMRTVADKIPTSDTKAINKECRRQIRVYNYQTRELDDEGFHAAIIPFPVISADAVLTYGLALLYSYELEMWRLEIIEIPDFGQLDHRRRPRAGGRPGGAQRVIIDAMAHVSCFVGDCAQAARAVLLESANLITRSSMSRGLAIFLYDTRTTLSWAQCLALLKSSLGTLRGIRKGLWLYNLWEKPLRNEADVAPLVRTRVNGALDFLGPFWSWEMPRPPYAIFDGLWDASWFGVEQANI